MSDMKIAVWLRRESCADMVVNALCQIFVNRKLDKIFGNNFFFFHNKVRPPSNLFVWSTAPKRAQNALCILSL
jgi:hypothetical protein